MKRYRSIILCTMALILMFCMSAHAVEEQVRGPLFSEAEIAASAATQAQADVLAPKSFGKATSYYKKAEKDFEKGRNLENIQKNLKNAVSFYQKSVEATKLSKVTFTDTIQTRLAAQEADSPEFSPDLWKQAEQKFIKAATQLENGDVHPAQKNGTEASRLFRESELDAIQNRLLAKTRTLIHEAETAKALDYAPNTLQSAKEMLQKAEESLAKNRYDTDEARTLSRLADYEARHAMSLTNKFLQIKNNATTMENVVLDFESLLNRMATSADIVAEFDGGYHKTAVEIIEYLEGIEKNTSDLNQQIQNLQSESTQLKETLGGARTDEVALKERIETQATIQKKFKLVDTMFTKDQAQVFREGNNICMRMVGLNFDVGKAVLEPDNFDLLTKTFDAITIFPESRIIVEGHTDSRGNDGLNLDLSRERAEVVRKYIVANMNISPERTSSVGYGETRPVANNETTAGRTMNRRIDIVIIPNLEQMM